MELLAPAGTIEALVAAVNAGADAVYFGLGELNARAKSIDFSLSNLREWTDYCHLYGVKVYITINVNVYDSELDRALELAVKSYELGADALIVSDLGLISAIRERFPFIPVHVSTQAGIKTVDGAEFYKKLGVTRVVLSREASIEEIASIQGVEKEVFVHGALCVAFSGNCLLSCYIGGKSGNRGQCRQPCRQEYTVTDEGGNTLCKGYRLSAKDICLDKYLSDLAKVGVDCLKIEGRLKSPEYVYSVTKYYRDLLDGLKPDKNDVLTAFARGGFTPAYFKNRNVIYPKTASHIGREVGKVLSVTRKNGFPYALVDVPFAKGDGLKILRKGVEVGGSDVTSCVKTDKGYLIPVSNGVEKGDVLCLTRSETLTDKVRKAKKRLGVSFDLSIGTPTTLTATYDKISVTVNGVDALSLRDLTYEEVYSQLSKTGNTDFKLDSLTFRGSGYLAKSALNQLRNNVLDALRSAIIDAYRQDRASSTDIQTLKQSEHIEGSIVESDKLIDGEYTALVYYPRYISITEYRKAVDYVKGLHKKLYIKFPVLLERAMQVELVKFARTNGIGIYADNIGVVELVREYSVPYIAGFGLNIANSLTADRFCDADAILSSVELGGYSVFGATHTFASGRIPLMHFEHCPNESVNGVGCKGCKNKGRTLYYNYGNNKFKLIGFVLDKRCYYSLYSDKTIKCDFVKDNKYISLIGGDAPVKSDGIIGE